MANADAFDVLESAGVIPGDLGAALKRMVGFRNIAVHRYHELDPAVIGQVIRSSLDDLLAFSTLALQLP